MGLLGQGDYVVLAQLQGGALVDALRWSHLTFGRVLDASSSASVTVPAFSSPSLGVLDGWSHEIGIRRNGEEVWVGPLQDPKWTQSEVTLPAADVYAWMQRRWLPRDRSYVDADAATIFAELAQDAMSTDPRPGLTIAASYTGVPATRTVLASDLTRAADVLDELARTAVDFTVIGRQLRVGGQEIPEVASFMLTDDVLDQPELESRGVDAATRVGVKGAGDIVAIAGSPADGYGLVEQSYSESDIEDQASADAAAGTRYAFLREPPKYLTGVLKPDAPVDFADLVPGARVRAKLATLDRPVDQDFRLYAVDVDVSVSESGIEESVKVTLQPMGTVAD